DADDVRIEQSTPVAGALTHCRDFNRWHFLQVVETDLGLAVRALAADRNFPRLGIDLRNVGKVVTDEELVIRRDRSAKIFDRGFVIRRTVRKLDKRLLARQRFERRLLTRARWQRGRKIEPGGDG